MHMSDQREYKYGWGQRVVACTDLFNDGSYPEYAMNALLVKRGTSGEVVQAGMHMETDTPVYMVEFGGNCVVGCFEEEIVLA
jgi:nitrogen fixation protein NifZ